MDERTPGAALGAIVLAAGQSSRMGAQKLLLPLGGRPLVVYAVAAACASPADPVLVVLGREAERVAEALPPGRQVTVLNPNYTSGMASSLRIGLDALPAATSGALILLGDQPLVTQAIVAALLDEARRSPSAIVVAAYAGKRGHPVYFPRHLFPELQAVVGDEGGRSVLAAHSKLVLTLDFGDLAANRDVDGPAEYQELLANWSAYYRPPPS